VPDPRENLISAAPLAAVPTSRGEAWTAADLADPHQHANKADKVRAMFGAIAPSYDLNNRLHSLGRDQAWRRAAVRAARVQPGDTVVDVACGTGDLTELFARSPAARVTGVDFTPQMLDVARAKIARRPHAQRSKVMYEEGDAQNLRFADASADVVSIAFGIRNVADPARAVREFARILRPGGRLVILEFGTPSFPPARILNNLYCGLVMPRTATLIARDRSGAYRYLPKSVGTFMPRAALCDLLAHAGFREVAARPLTMGLCVCYRAIRA
jgi:demethylmenaquinone methyltransferase/2-methoxy-6-polyprenyl-1,4-benzoquinol methylase